jgi:hypothetical protein
MKNSVFLCLFSSSLFAQTEEQKQTSEYKNSTTGKLLQYI